MYLGVGSKLCYMQHTLYRALLNPWNRHAKMKHVGEDIHQTEPLVATYISTTIEHNEYH